MKDKLYDAIRAPILSEKSSFLAENGKYSFVVAKDSTKKLIAKAVSGIFGVKVLKVNVYNEKPVMRRVKGKVGSTASYKRAVVSLEKGEKIDLFGSE